MKNLMKLAPWDADGLARRMRDCDSDVRTRTGTAIAIPAFSTAPGSRVDLGGPITAHSNAHAEGTLHETSMP